MTMTGYITSSIALDAVIIDTETAGLDRAKSRIDEIAAVPLVNGRFAADRSFCSLVRPPAQGDRNDPWASENGASTERDVSRAISRCGSDTLDARSNSW
jgi:DNA polymerase III epsilon subunit-like protein